MRIFIQLLVLLLCSTSLSAEEFSLHQLHGDGSGPTLLIIGGIDGDEPGGFHAAATLVTHYKINRGNLRIIPNLNFPAILDRRRGDLNLKFNGISSADPDYLLVKKIQTLLTDPDVDLILNLHDGSGFYSPRTINSRRNPERWGQSCVIDQELVPGRPYGRLNQLAEKLIKGINARALAKDHHFQLKNIHTGTAKNAYLTRQSLSWFAIRNGVPAMAVEASKSHPVHLRTFYHLLALEELMHQLSIDFSRDFSLTPEGVAQVLKDDALLSLADGRIQLELNNMRPVLKNFPLPQDVSPEAISRNPLVTLRQEGQHYRIHYGNNRLARLEPEWIAYDQGIDHLSMLIDGRRQNIPFGSIVPVQGSFLINNQEGCRANVIGFIKDKSSRDDGGVRIRHDQLNRGYSIDKSGRIYRVEVYRGESFSGMILIDFRPQGSHKEPLVAGHPATAEPESTN